MKQSIYHRIVCGVSYSPQCVQGLIAQQVGSDCCYLALHLNVGVKCRSQFCLV